MTNKSILEEALHTMGLETLQYLGKDRAPNMAKGTGWELVIQRPVGPNQAPVHLPLGQTTIGRHDGEKQIGIPHPLISREHLVLIRHTDERLEAWDLDTRNGSLFRQAPMKPGVKMEVHHGDTITLPEGSRLVFTKLEVKHQQMIPDEQWTKLVQTILTDFKAKTWGKDRQAVALELVDRLEVNDPNNCGCPEIDVNDGNAHIYNWPQICAHQNHAEYNMLVWKMLTSIPGLMKGLRQALQRHLRGKGYTPKNNETHERILRHLNHFFWPDAKRATWTHTKP